MFFKNVKDFIRKSGFLHQWNSLREQLPPATNNEFSRRSECKDLCRNCGAHGKKEISGKTSAESSIFQVLRLNIFSVVLAMTLIWNRNKKYRSRCWSQDCANVVYMLLTRREPGEAFRGYRRKLQTCLKLSRSYSWNYEPGLVIFYFVTNQLFGCEFK